MKRIVIAAVVGGLILFVWNFVSWMVLQLHNNAIHELSNEEATLAVLKSAAPEPGAYFFPWPPDDPTPGTPEFEAYTAKHEAGPVGMAIIVPDGDEVMPPTMFVFGFLIYAAGSLLAAVLLSVAAPQLGGYFGRVLFVAAFGVMIALMADLASVNWMRYPMDFALGFMIDRVAGWGLSGLAMAAIIRPKAASGSS